jgi:hypothetical protein
MPNVRSPPLRFRVVRQLTSKLAAQPRRCPGHGAVFVAGER